VSARREKTTAPPPTEVAQRELFDVRASAAALPPELTEKCPLVGQYRHDAEEFTNGCNAAPGGATQRFPVSRATAARHAVVHQRARLFMLLSRTTKELVIGP